MKGMKGKAAATAADAGIVRHAVTSAARDRVSAGPVPEAAEAVGPADRAAADALVATVVPAQVVPVGRAAIVDLVPAVAPACRGTRTPVPAVMAATADVGVPISVLSP